MTTGQLIATGVIVKEGRRGQAAFNRGLVDWEINSARIESQLETYFPKTFSHEWQKYSKVLEDMYFLSGTGLKRRRCARTQRVKNYLKETKGHNLSCWEAPQTQKRQAHDCKRAESRPKNEPSWTFLASCDGNNRTQYLYKRGEPYYGAYRSKSQEVLARGRMLIREMLSQSPAGF